jgi:aminoglycoside 3-N-acetyltransferase
MHTLESLCTQDRYGVVAGLCAAWTRAGIRHGDCVLLHSSLLRLLNLYRRHGYRLDPETILESFLESIGPSGTLLLPTFNFGFTRGLPFNILHTPSEMGVLTEVARHHPFAVRTRHPIYSFAVIGRYADRFADLGNIDSFGPGSPFALLIELGGRIAVLGLADQGSMTSYHHAEQIADVDYRYHKSFEAQYIDADGSRSRRAYRMHVRDIERGVVTSVEPMGELLWAQGCYMGERFDVGHGLRVIDAAVLLEKTLAEIRAGRAKGMLYRIDPEEAKR